MSGLNIKKKKVFISKFYLSHRLLWWLRWQRICLQCGRPGFDPWAREDPLEKEITTHSSILAYKIPRTEKPGGSRGDPQSVGTQRVAHD